MADLVTSSSEKWSDISRGRDSNSTWFDAISHRANAPGLNAFSYESPVSLQEDFWQSLLNQGEVFLQDVLGLITQGKVIRPCDSMIVLDDE